VDIRPTVRPGTSGTFRWSRTAIGLTLQSMDAQRLLSEFDQLEQVVVAFSGGADSACVLAAAVRALGESNVIAATVISPSLAAGELEAAAGFARELGVRHVKVPGYELSRPGYVINDTDRCAHCKTELMDVLLPLARKEFGWNAQVVTGTNAEDALDPHRPGIAAAARAGALTPLANAGMSKAEVRELSKQWRLRTWDKPQAACLASRLAYGVPVSASALARVDQSEICLRSLLNEVGIKATNVRVRDLGQDRARIEIDHEQVIALLPHREAVARLVKGEGFADVEIATAGFRSGSMNEMTRMPQPRKTSPELISTSITVRTSG